MKNFSELQEQFLDYINSELLQQMEDGDLVDYLNNLVFRSVASFNFPKLSLAYGIDSEGEYYFLEQITQREVNVLIAYMKAYWLEKSADSDSDASLIYYDRDVKTYDAAKREGALQKRLTNARKEVQNALKLYYQAETDGKAAIGKLYE